MNIKAAASNYVIEPAAIPVLIVYIIFQRQLQGSVAQGTCH